MLRKNILVFSSVWFTMYTWF